MVEQLHSGPKSGTNLTDDMTKFKEPFDTISGYPKKEASHLPKRAIRKEGSLGSESLAICGGDGVDGNLKEGRYI